MLIISTNKFILFFSTSLFEMFFSERWRDEMPIVVAAFAAAEKNIKMLIMF